MENNVFETLEEVETIKAEPVKEEKSLKEYEKLLLAEASREAYEKASNLVKFGCFEQQQLTTVDFSKYEKIDTEKKYKGLYNLYRDVETMELVFIAPLVENNKGDKDERKDMKPYAYDVITTEAMDEETYKMVCHAAKNNIKNAVQRLYLASWITYIILGVILLIDIIYIIILTSSQENFVWVMLTQLFYNYGTYMAVMVLATIFMGIFTIQYKKYKEQ